MAQYSDGAVGDINANEDNYWAFVTGLSINNNPATTLDGYSFDPMATYETNFAVRDGGGTAAGGDGDYVIDSKASDNHHGNDGVAFGGNIYHIARNWVMEATITYAGTNQTVQTTVVVSRIVDPNNDSSTPLHSTALIRIRDNQIQTVYEGPDGAGGEQYSLAQIESITLGAIVAEPNRIGIANQYDNPFPVICFAEGTLIETKAGQVPVEKLRVNDLVQTVDNGIQPIRWIGSRYLTEDELERNPKLRPIRIEAGALGHGCPSTDLVLSPQHRVLIAAQWARELFGSDEVMVPVKKLVSLPQIEVADNVDYVTYFHILLDHHELLQSNGALTESLYLGPQTLKSLSPEGMEEVAALFPELVNGEEKMTPARQFVQKNGDVRRLLEGA